MSMIRKDILRYTVFIQFALLLCSLFCDNASYASGASDASIPEITGNFGKILDQFGAYDVILEPDQDAPEWWAGAPSVVRDVSGIFWLAARMRTADSPRGLRGYEIRILRSEDGRRFEKVHSILREEVPIPGFERPALLQDPVSGKFKLYGCGPWQDGPWAIIKFADAERPDRFVPSSAYPVITAPVKAYERDAAPTEYKDPVVIHAAGLYHCFTTGYIRRNERIFHFQSADGETWEAVGNPYTSLMPLSGWHDFFVRPASVLSLGVGYLFIYEGSDSAWYDPVYNIGTGLGFTFDLHNIIDLTPESPLLLSRTPSAHFATFRYSTWLWVDGELWVYAEVARPNQSNEIRLYRLKI